MMTVADKDHAHISVTKELLSNENPSEFEVKWTTVGDKKSSRRRRNSTKKTRAPAASSACIDMMVFSEVQDEEAKHRIEGTIKRSGFLKVAGKQTKINQFLRNREDKAMEPKRTTQELYEQRRLTYTKPINIQPAPKAKTRKDIKPQSPAGPRVRVERKLLRSMIFAKYEKKDFWKLKELNKEFRQPENFLKTVMKELAVYHKKGPHKGYYEIKKEYKSEKSAE